MFFFPFLCSVIPDLALGTLKKLICICFRNVLQPAVYKFVPGMMWLSANLYRKWTVCTEYAIFFLVTMFSPSLEAVIQFRHCTKNEVFH